MAYPSLNSMVEKEKEFYRRKKDEIKLRRRKNKIIPPITEEFKENEGDSDGEGQIIPKRKMKEI